MKNKKLFLLPILALLFASCLKEIPYKGEGKDPVLILNGVAETDSTFKVFLERSFFFLSNEATTDKYIKAGATITLTNLTSGEVFSMNASTYDNVYEFPFFTPENTKFKIEISHPDYETISSEMTTVSKVALSSVDTSSYTTQDGLRKKAILKWKDPIGENYYFIRVNLYDPKYDYSYDTYFASSDPSVSNGSNTNIGGQEEFDEAVFSDNLFEGQEKTFELNFYTYIADSVQNQPIYTYQLITMNKDTYLYYQSAKKHMNGSGFLTEPIKVYSNINNGFGIFGTRNTSKITK
ncbi:MAG: DUF4249 domain-containing protein [Flavobacteriia bacterium]|jgi:hypothetical protein